MAEEKFPTFGNFFSPVKCST